MSYSRAITIIKIGFTNIALVTINSNFLGRPSRRLGTKVTNSANKNRTMLSRVDIVT